MYGADDPRLKMGGNQLMAPEPGDDAAAPGGENPEGAQKFKDQYTGRVKGAINEKRAKRQQAREQRQNARENFREARKGMNQEFHAKRKQMRADGASREDIRAAREDHQNRKKSHRQQHREHQYGQRMMNRHFNAPEEGMSYGQAQQRYKDNVTGREFNVNHGGYTPKDSERFSKVEPQSITM